MNLFEKDFEIRKKNSIFEFAIISLAVAEREDLQIFEKERKNCQNRVDKILFHGTKIQIVKDDVKKIDPISSILTWFFHKSRCIQHGQVIYLQMYLILCGFYWGKDNRYSGNVIPNINDTFTFFHVPNFKTKMVLEGYMIGDIRIKKIDFAYADNVCASIHREPDKTQFW